MMKVHALSLKRERSVIRMCAKEQLTIDRHIYLWKVISSSLYLRYFLNIYRQLNIIKLVIKLILIIHNLHLYNFRIFIYIYFTAETCK